MAADPRDRRSDDGPPFLSNWNAVYVLVLGGLLVSIALLALVSAAYR